MPRLGKLCSPLRLALRALAPSLALLLASPAGADGGAPPDAPPGAEDPSREAAKSAVQRGQRAFQAGDYAAAIDAFDEANRLRPTPKLDYNLGICHQRLHASARAEGDHDGERLHANAAIDAYNRYLRARPTAEDRPAVEALVRELGGTPATSASLKPVPEEPARAGRTTAADDGGGPTSADAPEPDGSAEGDKPAPQDTSTGRASEQDPQATGAVDPAEARRPRGALVLGLGLWSLPQMNDHPTVEASSMGTLNLRGGALLGRQGRLFVGAGIAAAGGGNSRAQTKLGSVAQAFDGLVGLHVPVGAAGRLVIPLTGIVGAGREALRTRTDIPRPACAVGSDTLVGARWGARLGLRAGVLLLFGEQRKHGLSIDLDGTATLYGRGATAEGCAQSLFQELAVPRVRASIGLGVGYGVRF